MRNSSSYPPSAARTGTRFVELAAVALAGVVAALLLEAGGALDKLPGWSGQALWLIGALLLSAAAWRWRAQPLLRVACVGLAAALYALSRLTDYHWHRLEEADGWRTLVDATVLSLPEQRADEVRLQAQLRPARPAPAAVAAGDVDGEPTAHWPMNAHLLWSRAPPVQVGEHWQLLVSLNTPAHARNPGQGWFNRQDLRSQLHATGSVVESRLNLRTALAGPSIDRLRAWLAAAIRSRVIERDAAALLVALAVGDTQYVSREQWRVYNAVGITHLIAISGLHVTLFSILCAALARRVWRWTPWLWRIWRRESFAALCGVSAACVYALLSGFSVPAQRTLLMLGTWHLLRALARPAAVAPALAVSLLLVLLIDPLAPLGAGFWLSFVAVAVLLHALGPASASTAHHAWWTRAFDAAAELWGTQWRVALGLLPVTLAVFGTASLAGLCVNLLAIPLFSFVLVPLILLSLPLLAVAPPVADLMLRLAAWVYQCMAPWLIAAANWDHALWRVEAPGWAVLLALPAVWLLLLPARWPQRGTALLALLPVVWPRVIDPPPGEFQATALDAGRGPALIVRTAHHALLFDNGEHWGSDGAVSRDVVLPALRAARIATLDRLIMPRLDNDRAAGLAWLAASLRVRSWQASGAVDDMPPEFAPCRGGEQWQWDGVQFQSLLDGDCALRIVAAGGYSLLIGGELDRDAQQQLAAAGMAASTAVVLPRSAARSADCAAFRDASGARWAIVGQSARGARAASVRATLSAWRDAGAQVWVTGESGAALIQVSPRGLRVSAATD